MEYNWEKVLEKAKKDSVDEALLNMYLLVIEDRVASGEDDSNTDDFIDHRILVLYTWHHSEVIKKTAIEEGKDDNLFEVFQGSIDPKRRKLLEDIANPDPVLNYHVAGLIKAREQIRQFAGRFGISTPLNRTIKEYILKAT